MKELHSILAFAALLVGALMGFNAYYNDRGLEQKNKDREAYMECLRITEKLLKEKPDRISTPYCRL